MKLTLRVQYGCARAGLPGRAAIRAWARAALAGMRRRRVELTVRIAGAAEGARLNRRYRGRRGATNVLSFPYENPPGVRTDMLGDLVICAPVVAREARAGRPPAAAHWAHMVVHGIMHLRGYDHRNRKEAAIMEAREARVLARLGFPDPYSASNV